MDGRVDITDAVLLNKAIAGAVELDTNARQNGDCKQDGELTLEDAVTLLQFLVHVISSLPQLKKPIPNLTQSQNSAVSGKSAGNGVFL